MTPTASSRRPSRTSPAWRSCRNTRPHPRLSCLSCAPRSPAVSSSNRPRACSGETLDISVEDAFTYMRTYAHATDEHLTDVARRLMTDRHSRFALVAAISEFATAPTQ